jgi:hypothetical protein
MSCRVAVIGAGASGVAAAWAAAQSGAHVMVVLGGVGATSLSSGALDGSPEDGSTEMAAFASALGLWHIEPSRLATNAGLLRAALGHDRALLNLEKIEGGLVGVVDVRRRGWDAATLAHAWTSEPWAMKHGLRFEAIAIEALLRSDEELLPLADLAARHDEPERVGWLADRLRGAPLAAASAIVMGPWLGLRTGVASDLARVVGKPIGEPLSLPGEVSGLRFDRARDALFAELGVERIAGWADLVEVGGPTARVALESTDVFSCDAVVLASGGLTGGGITWSSDGASVGFVTSPRHLGSLAIHGRVLYASGSPGGDLFEKYGWHGGAEAAGIECVGVWVDERGAVRRTDGSIVPRLHAAGDLAADRPRTMLEAIRSGLVAGAAAAQSWSPVATSSA